MSTAVLAEVDPKSERRAVRFMRDTMAMVVEIQRLRATADQLAMEISNGVALRAPELSDDLSYDDMVSLLRAVAGVVR